MNEKPYAVIEEIGAKSLKYTATIKTKGHPDKTKVFRIATDFPTQNVEFVKKSAIKRFDLWAAEELDKMKKIDEIIAKAQP